MEKLDSFKLYLIREGLAPGTIEKDVVILKRLMQLEVLAGDTIDGFLLSQLQNGRAPGYLNNVVKACHTWGKFTEDPTLQKLKFFKVKENNKATLSDAEIEAFLVLPKPKQAKPERYRMWNLFFKIMAYSGMRAGEVAKLTIPQIDFGRQVFILDETKTTPRLVPIASILISELEEYIKNISTESLFLIDGKAVDKNKWNEHFQMRIRRLGIKRPHLSTHSMRHSFITRNYAHMSLFDLMDIVGHKSSETTRGYAHLSTETKIRAIKKDPLGKKNIPYFDRLKQFREGVWQLLEQLAFSPDEEREMIQYALKGVDRS